MPTIPRGGETRLKARTRAAAAERQRRGLTTRANLSRQVNNQVRSLKARNPSLDVPAARARLMRRATNKEAQFKRLASSAKSKRVSSSPEIRSIPAARQSGSRTKLKARTRAAAAERKRRGLTFEANLSRQVGKQVRRLKARNPSLDVPAARARLTTRGKKWERQVRSILYTRFF